MIKSQVMCIIIKVDKGFSHLSHSVYAKLFIQKRLKRTLDEVVLLPQKRVVSKGM